MQARLFAYTDSLNTIEMNVKATYEKIRNTDEYKGGIVWLRAKPV